MRKPNGYWTKENCINEAKKYKSRVEFEKLNRSACVIARINLWIDECCTHMIRLGSKYKRLIYAFEFPDKSVYVGLTYNSNQRKLTHLSDLKSQVYKYIQETGLQPKFKEITDYLDKNIASQKEDQILNQYKNEGWKILNKIKGGGLGGDTIKWTKENCIQEANKYIHRSQFKKFSGGAFNAARRNKWLDDITIHMVKPQVWNKGIKILK